MKDEKILKDVLAVEAEKEEEQIENLILRGCLPIKVNIYGDVYVNQEK